MTEPTPTEQSFLRSVALLAIPILVGEICHVVREYLKREHEATIRRRGDGPPAGAP